MRGGENRRRTTVGWYWKWTSLTEVGARMDGSLIVSAEMLAKGAARSSQPIPKSGGHELATGMQSGMRWSGEGMSECTGKGYAIRREFLLFRHTQPQSHSWRSNPNPVDTRYVDIHPLYYQYHNYC